MMPAAKPRILFLLTTSDWGGVQFFVYTLALAAQRQGSVVAVAAGGTGELGERCTRSGLRFIHLKTLRRDISPLRDLAAIHELQTLIRTFKPDAVHLNSSKMGVLGSIAAARERVPRVIYRIGGWSFLEDISLVKQWLYKKAEQWSASKKDIIVTVHPGDERIARQEKIVPRRQLVTIPNGIDLTRFDRELLSREDARRQLGVSPDRFVIGTVANYYPPKNLTTYLKILAPLFSNHPTLQAVIIGDGPERERIKTLHRNLGLEGHVVLAGRRDRPSRLLRAFDVFVLPSSKEGMPWALLEAMAAGLPCIATDVGACRWMLEARAGIIVPTKDSQALQVAVLHLMTHPTERVERGLAARHGIESRFRWETTLTKTLELFEP